MEKYAAGLTDADKAIVANPQFIKGYYRKSQALFALGKTKESKMVLLSVVKNLKVNNKDINDRIKILSKIIKEKLFFESIKYENEIEKLDPEKLVVPSKYDGPRLEKD